MTHVLRIATRKSPLALWQAEFVANQLKHHHPNLHIELLPMVTSGDKFLKDKLLTIGGKGLFVKELEDALLKHRADIAVHSMKDVPVMFPDGLALTTICRRDNPFDALVSQHYDSITTLPLGARIGTSSLRRQAQLLCVRSDLNMVSIRGNIQTRLEKLNECDAIILAAAGLMRMGMQDEIKQILPTDMMLPACGQGALGIECRIEDERIQNLLAPLHDPDTALCVNTERRVNALLGGNCHVPLAVFAEIKHSTQIVLQAKVASSDGQTTLYDQKEGPIEDALSLADQCAKTLLSKGAQKLLQT